jgi:branched-chain amino acid transport system ATP-binding protein
VIRAEGVAVQLGAVEVLHGIDLQVARGSVVAVVGANGAGKTTVLRTLSRLVPLRRGALTFDGRDIASLPPHEVARLGLVHVPQGRQIVPGLTVEDNLLLGARRSPHIAEAELPALLDGEYARFPILRERRRVLGGALSGGEQQMLAISRALMMRPKVLMLDEPSLGLAPQVVSAIFAALKALTVAGMTVLLVEQAAFLALKIADRGYVLQRGKVAAAGTTEELLRDKRLIERYLG